MRSEKTSQRLARDWDASFCSADPLLRTPNSWIADLGMWLGFGLAGFALLGVATTAIAGANKLLGADELAANEERIAIAVMERLPEPEPIAEPELEPEPVVEAEPVVKPKPVAKLKPKPKPKAVEPPPDPVDLPDQEPPPDKTPPRKIVGLDFASTVQGGAGPSFATGNTRMGTTTKAVDPESVKRLRPEAQKATLSPKGANRPASRIPGSKAKFVKPKRKRTLKPIYPALYREQGLEDSVVVEAQLTASGKVKEVTILSPSQHELFNKEALRVAKLQEFSPATKDGVAIPFRISFTIRFRISQ